MLIKEVAPVGTRIAKLVVTDRKSAKLESDLRFNLMSERVQKLPIFDRLPKRQVVFPGGKQITVDDEEDSDKEDINDTDEFENGVIVDPVNRHFAVRFYPQLKIHQNFPGFTIFSFFIECSSE